MSQGMVLDDTQCNPQRDFLKKIYLFYLTEPGLGCVVWGLLSLFRPEGSLIVACELLVVACGTWFPDPGSNLGPLHWELGVLASRQRPHRVGDFRGSQVLGAT